MRLTLSDLVDSEVRGSRYCRVSVMSQNVSAPVLVSVAVALYAGTTDGLGVEDVPILICLIDCSREAVAEAPPYAGGTADLLA